MGKLINAHTHTSALRFLQQQSMIPPWGKSTDQLSIDYLWTVDSMTTPDGAVMCTSINAHIMNTHGYIAQARCAVSEKQRGKLQPTNTYIHHIIDDLGAKSLVNLLLRARLQCHTSAFVSPLVSGDGYAWEGPEHSVEVEGAQPV